MNSMPQNPELTPQSSALDASDLDLTKSRFPSGIREALLSKGRNLVTGVRKAWHLTREFVTASVDDGGTLRELAKSYLKGVNLESRMRLAYIPKASRSPDRPN